MLPDERRHPELTRRLLTIQHTSKLIDEPRHDDAGNDADAFCLKSPGKSPGANQRGCNPAAFDGLVRRLRDWRELYTTPRVRPIAAKLTLALGQNFYVENMGGAGGTVPCRKKPLSSRGAFGRKSR